MSDGPSADVRSRTRGVPALAGLLLLLMGACSERPGAPTSGGDLARLSTASQPVGATAVVAIAHAIQAEIAGPDSALGGLSAAERTDLRALYEQDRYVPLWLDVDLRPDGNAREASRLLDAAMEDGLDPADYYQALRAALMGRVTTASPSAREAASLDVALSAGTLRYFRHLHMGRVDPRAIGFRLSVPADRHEFPTLLRAALAQHRIAEAAAELAPAMTQYSQLRTLLARYRALAADPALEAPSPVVTSVRPGHAYPALGALQRLLVALGDLPAATPPAASASRYDGPLVDAVKGFQRRHGLEADGILGRNTVAALRVPLAWRVRQIELALERLRWLPHPTGGRLLLINIPMFRLWAWSAAARERPSLGMAVIVGRALGTQTPVFAREMREVIFRPYWNVPRSILRHEILPIIERDPGYLQREDMEIVRGAGDDAQPVAAGPESIARLRQGALRVRQRPGPRNALGLIKFVFPNEADVYMHGTPAQELFARTRRDFSHGCVRVEDPVSLAEWALSDREWTRDRILSAMAGEKSVRVRLARPIQVILFYTTAAVQPRTGSIRFADDVYGHDARLDRALATRRAPR